MLKETSLQLMLLPAMIYGAETWALDPHPSKEQVREKTQVTNVIEQVRRRNRNWAWHVSRIRDNRWTLRITTWKGKYLGEDRRDVGETKWTTIGRVPSGRGYSAR